MTTLLTLPPIEVLAESAAALVEEAGENAARRNALNKACYHLQTGVTPLPTFGGFLVESGTRGGMIHRVSTVSGCSCEAGQRQRPCWHQAMIEIIEAAQTHAVPTSLRLTEERAARYTCDEVAAAYDQGADDALAAVERHLVARQAKVEIDADIFARQAAAEAALLECFA